MDATSTQLYISLLEKTNQQLNLWNNPYAWITAVLSLLVAVLAVGTAIGIWRQSKEYKDSFSKALKDYKEILDNKINIIGVDAQSKINNVVTSYQGELESIKKSSVDVIESKDKIEKIEAKIKELQKEKDIIGSGIKFSSIIDNQYNPLSFSADNSDILKVSRIGNELGLSQENYCPQCGSYYGGSVISILKPNYCSNCGVKL
jgi:hypothetical protein